VSSSRFRNRARRAAHLLFFKRHSKPGAKGWELRRRVGRDYPKVLEFLDETLKPLDLQVKVVSEEGKPLRDLSRTDLEKARFFIRLRGHMSSGEAKMCGWRIDDLAGLAISIAYIISKNGKAPRKDLEDILALKLPGWRVDWNLNRYVRNGYLGEDENGVVFLDWRTLAEVDYKTLVDVLIAAEPEQRELSEEIE
jgi:hypothetical protein